MTLVSRNSERPDRVSGIGYGLSILVWIATMVVFWTARCTFLGNAHYFAAIPMFLLIVFVVVISAIGWRADRGGRRTGNPYTLLAITMVSALVVCVGLGRLADWSH